MEDFCIKITNENRAIVKEWWYGESPYDERVFSIDAHYGMKGGKMSASCPRIQPLSMNVVELEEFLLLTSKELTYNIY